ncbi:alpha/beta hydrolase [bacterium]|nr:alpha/beta hydrolase [bacterium]
MKEPLVMIPGTLCDNTLFKHQMDGLKDLADCQIGDHSSSDDLKKVAANIIEKFKGDFSILGLSYGGIIAFEIWRQVPKRVKRIMLLNTNHREPSETTRANQQRFLGMSMLGEFREITTDFLKDAMLYSEHAKDHEIRKAILEMAINTGRAKFHNQIKAQLYRPDSTPDLPNILCPVLVMTGKQDKVCTPEIHKEIAELIPNSTLELIDKCGHLSTMEQPDEVNRIIRDWWINN